VAAVRWRTVGLRTVGLRTVRGRLRLRPVVRRPRQVARLRAVRRRLRLRQIDLPSGISLCGISRGKIDGSGTAALDLE
jgi:hypothetical protein